MKIKLFREAKLGWLEMAVNEYLKPFPDDRVELYLTTEPGNPADNAQVTVMVVIKEEE
jgi:hypothetical protein